MPCIVSSCGRDARVPGRSRRAGSAGALALGAVLAALGACTIDRKPDPADSAKAAAAAAGGDTARGGASFIPGVNSAADSTRGATTGAVAGTAAGDSASRALGAASDSAAAAAAGAALVIEPAQPRRGDVIYAFLPGAAEGARCTWRNRPLPCHAHAGGVLALVAVPADDSAGTYRLTIDGPGGRASRDVTVADREFGREVVVLPRTLYTQQLRGPDGARDARALRTVLANESAERRWTGAWREPAAGLSIAKAEGYGVERFYIQSSDSARAFKLTPTMRARGSFGVDTGAVGPSDVPSWRHAGVDLAAPRRSAVRATADGAVVDVGEYSRTGRTLVIDHGQGVMSAYFHLDTVTVRRGDEVHAGQSVARVGATGLATGPHLHYGVYVHGADVDPAAWWKMPAWVRDDRAPADSGAQVAAKRR